MGLTPETDEPEEPVHTDLAERDEGWSPPAPELHALGQLATVLATVALLVVAALAAAWLVTRLLF